MTLSPPPALFLAPSPVASPPAPVTAERMRCLPPPQVWASLPLPQQIQVRQALLALLQDVLHDRSPA
jgi:hypothetical protein